MTLYYECILHAFGADDPSHATLICTASSYCTHAANSVPLPVLRCTCGRPQERIASDCIGLLRAVTKALADCCTAIGLGTPARGAQRARPQPRWKMLQLGERCTVLQMMAQALVTCLWSHVLRGGVPDRQLLAALGLLIRQVTPVPCLCCGRSLKSNGAALGLARSASSLNCRVQQGMVRLATFNRRLPVLCPQREL